MAVSTKGGLGSNKGQPVTKAPAPVIGGTPGSTGGKAASMKAGPVAKPPVITKTGGTGKLGGVMKVNNAPTPPTPAPTPAPGNSGYTGLAGGLSTNGSGGALNVQNIIQQGQNVPVQQFTVEQAKLGMTPPPVPQTRGGPPVPDTVLDRFQNYIEDTLGVGDQPGVGQTIENVFDFLRQVQGGAQSAQSGAWPALGGALAGAGPGGNLGPAYIGAGAGAGLTGAPGRYNVNTVLVGGLTGAGLGKGNVPVTDATQAATDRYQGMVDQGIYEVGKMTGGQGKISAPPAAPFSEYDSALADAARWTGQALMYGERPTIMTDALAEQFDFRRYGYETAQDFLRGLGYMPDPNTPGLWIRLDPTTIQADSGGGYGGYEQASAPDYGWGDWGYDYGGGYGHRNYYGTGYGNGYDSGGYGGGRGGQSYGLINWRIGIR